METTPRAWNPGQTALRILTVLGLLYVFLLSITMMGSAFKLFGKGFAEALIRGCTNPFAGLFIGVLATGLIQSSSTTTSLVVGFVGGGVLPLQFAVPLIMGANIGTTITNLLVSFGFVTRREDFRRAFAGATVHDFFNICSVIVLFPLELRFHIIQKAAERMTAAFSHMGGVTFTSPLKMVIDPCAHAVKDLFLLVFKLSPVWSGSLMILLAAAMLVASLVFLVRVLRQAIAERAERVINRYLFRNDLFAFLIGVALTVMVQSSSVTTSMLVPLVGAGVVALERCYPYTLGANVGTTCTALLAALATVSLDKGGTLGLTAAFAHLMFNILGIAIFYPLRRVPISLARWLGAVASESRRLAVFFVLGVFFVVPLLMLGLGRLLNW